MHRVHSGFLKLAVTASMLLWASIAVTPATAASLMFNFSGTVGNGDTGLLSALNFPTSVNGSYTIDSAPPASSDTDANPNIGGYNLAITNPFVLNIVGIGTYQGTLGNSTNFIELQTQPGFDQFSMTAPITGSLAGSYSPLSFDIKFIRPPGTFGSNALTAPTLGNLIGPASFHVFFAKGFGKEEINGTVNISAVPLPPAVILFGAGLVALVGLGAGRWRKQGINVA